MKVVCVCSVCDEGLLAPPVLPVPIVASLPSLVSVMQLLLVERTYAMFMVFRGDLVFMLMHMFDEFECMCSLTRSRLEVCAIGERV